MFTVHYGACLQSTMSTFTVNYKYVCCFLYVLNDGAYLQSTMSMFTVHYGACLQSTMSTFTVNYKYVCCFLYVLNDGAYLQSIMSMFTVHYGACLQSTTSICLQSIIRLMYVAYSQQ